MTRMSTKKRVIRFNSSLGRYETFVGTTFIAGSNYLVNDIIVQRTDSQGNPFGRLNRLHKKYVKVYGYDPTGSQDVGGPFTTYRVQTTSYPKTRFNIKGGVPTSVNRTYVGRAVAWDINPNISESNFLQPSSAAVLDALGTTAIARCIPTNPLAGMGQFLGELHDLPSIPDIRKWKNRVRNFRNGAKRINFDKLSRDAGGEYLNQVFGWMPFVGDLEKLVKVTRDVGPLMEKFARGANHLIHRQYHFPVETTTTVETLGSGNPQYPQPSLDTSLWTTGGKLTKTTRTETKVWFKGAFTYHLPTLNPDDNGFVKTIEKAKYAEAQANRLYGLRLTPDLIWKLTPWSWAVGWVSNAGDVIHNWSAFASDGLVMDYGYIMETKIQIVTYSLTDVGCSAGKVNFVQEFRYVTKTRRRATPYGFGVNPASFTAKQWSIIAALGISKQPLSLNF